MVTLLYAHEDWWRATYNDGKGAVYIGQPQFDTTHNITIVPIALPLYSHDTHELVGVLHTNHSLLSLTVALVVARFGETGDSDVLLPSGALLRSEGNLVPIEAADLAQLKQHANGIIAEFDYDHEHRLVSQMPVTARDDQAAAITDLGWVLIIDQDPAEAFAPISAAVRSTFLTGLVALIAATLLAFVVAQAISAPIKRLTLTVQQIASGDLSLRMALWRRDEIGLLASGVNTMADSLETRISTEQQAQAEAFRLQQAEVEGRQRLEQVVGDYLAFVQRVSQGDLTQRLTIQHEGALGQLGQGLNGMVESLQSITS